MSGTDWNALYGVGSQLYQDEAHASWENVKKLFNDYSQLRGQTQPAGMMMQNQVPATQAPPAGAGWTDEDLVGAGMYWGLPEQVVRAMPRQDVIDYVNKYRGYAREGGGSAVANTLAPLAMFGVGAGEAITGTLQKLPLIGDWLSQGGIVHSADMKLRQLEEGVRSSTPEGEQTLLSVANVTGNLAAMWYPGTAAWAIAGKLGRVVPLVSKATPIGRAAFQGGLSAYMLMGGTKEGDPNPWLHRAEVIGGGALMGGAFEAATPALMRLTQRVVNRFVSPSLLQPGDLAGIGAPGEAAVRGNFDVAAGPRGPADLAEMAAGGDEQAKMFLDYISGGKAGSAGSLGNEMPYWERGAASMWEGGTDQGKNRMLGGKIGESFPDIPWEALTPEQRMTVGKNTGYLKEVPPPAVDKAEALATQMNKASSIIESNEFPAISGQTMMDDLAVATAQQADNPGGTNIVQGITNPADFIQGLGKHVQFAQRNGRLDALVSPEPLSPRAIAQYEQHGMYEGQRVLTSDGLPMTIRGIGETGQFTQQAEALVEPVYSGAQTVRPLSDLHPMVSSPGSVEVPQLWDAFQLYTTQKAAETQVAMGGALTEGQLQSVRSRNLATWMEDFFADAKINDPASQDQIRQYFNYRWVDQFKNLAPMETAVQQSLSASIPAVSRPPVQALDRAATTKGFRVVPENEGVWHVEDMVSGNTPPKPPVSPTEPVQITAPGSKMTFGSREEAERWLQQVNRTLPDITPETEVPFELAARHPQEPVQEPNLNHVEIPNTGKSIAEMAVDSDGGANFPPTEKLAADNNIGGIKNRWIQAFLRWRPARRLMSALDQGLIEHTGQSTGLAGDYDGLAQRIVQHHNEMNPWMDELTDIFKPVKTKFLADGTWTRIYQAADPATRVQLAQRAGFSPKEIESFAKYDDLMMRLFPGSTPEDIQQIPKFISHIAQRQSRAETVGSAFEEFPLGLTTQAFYDYARQGSLNFRELHPGTLGETMLRSVFWQKNMAPMWDGLAEKYGAMARSTDDALSQVGAIMQQQLRLVKFGYQAADDTALDTVHGVLQALVGPEVTRQQAREMFNFGLNSVHSGMLGFQPSKIARDMLQAFLALPRAGPEVLASYAKWMSSSAARQKIWSEAVAEGAVSLQSPRTASPGAFVGELERLSTAPVLDAGPSEYGVRMRGLAKISGAIRDLMPEWLRDTRDSPFHAMYLYGKQAEMTRALIYTAGKDKATKALAAYRAGGSVDMEGLMGASAARTYDPSWQRQFQQLVTSGADDEAARFLGRQLADATQFKYGVSESPWIAKSMTGRMAMQFGNYPMQYFQFLRESLTNGTLGDKAKLVTLAGATTIALDKASDQTGWNFRWMNPFAGLGFTGGPLISGLSTVAQGARSAMGIPMNPNQSTSPIMAGVSAAGRLVQQANPLNGLWQTAQGIGQGLDSPLPEQAILRHLVTGETGAAPDINNVLLPQASAAFQRSLQPIQNPVRGTGIGLPPGQFPQQLVVDPPMLQGQIQPPGNQSQNPTGSFYHEQQIMGALQGDSASLAAMSPEDRQLVQSLSGLPLGVAIQAFRQTMEQRVRAQGSGVAPGAVRP